MSTPLNPSRLAAAGIIFSSCIPPAEKTESYKTVKQEYKDETEQTIYERTEFTGSKTGDDTDHPLGK